MSNKHFTTNSVLRDVRERKYVELERIRRERQRAANERAQLLALQRKFAQRSGHRAVV